MKYLKLIAFLVVFIGGVISIKAQVKNVKKPINKNIELNKAPDYKINLPETKNVNIRAAFRGPTGAVYFFTDTNYSRYNIYPDNLQKVTEIKGNWSKVPEEIDATLFNKDKNLAYFFKGKKYYRYNFSKGKVDNIALISKNWKGVPVNIDAAIQHSNGKFYFFKGNNYYRYSSKTHKVDNIALISKNWKGVPNNIDAVLLHKNGKLYFFKDKKYYRYNSKLRKVDKVGTLGVDGWKGFSFKLGSGSELTAEKVKVKKNALLPFAIDRADIKYTVKNGNTFIEDDIVVGTSSQVIRPRPKPHPKRPDFKQKYDKNRYGYIIKYLVAAESDECLWAFGIIPYEIGSDFTSEQRQKIIDALDRLDKETNLTIVPRNRHVDYIRFKNNLSENVGNSPVGRIGGKQTVNLGGLSEVHIAHEVMHSAGFYHEQSRRDRDRYVTINFNDIESGRGHNFDKHEGARPVGPYDFKSIMHYRPNAFSNSQQPTIVPKNPSNIIDRGDWLSDIDADGINIIYKQDYNSSAPPPLKTLRKLELVIKKLEAKSGTDGCGEVEFFSKTEIGPGHTWQAGANGNNTIKKQSGTVKGRQISPNWKHTGAISKNTQTAKILLVIKEEDGGFCFSDDWADVNPLNGSMAIQLQIMLTNGEIYIWNPKTNKREDYVGQIGTTVSLQGFETSDKDNDETIPVHVEFRVDVKAN